MLFNPDTMPEYSKKKPKRSPGTLSSDHSVGVNKKVSYRQKEKGRHNQPSIYTATKVEKRKS